MQILNWLTMSMLHVSKNCVCNNNRVAITFDEVSKIYSKNQWIIALSIVNNRLIVTYKKKYIVMKPKANNISDKQLIDLTLNLANKDGFNALDKDATNFTATFTTFDDRIVNYMKNDYKLVDAKFIKMVIDYVSRMGKRNYNAKMIPTEVETKITKFVFDNMPRFVKKRFVCYTTIFPHGKILILLRRETQTSCTLLQHVWISVIELVNYYHHKLFHFTFQRTILVIYLLVSTSQLIHKLLQLLLLILLRIC